MPEGHEKDAASAHRRISEVVDSMHSGFTQLRQEMARDKADIMGAIDRVSHKTASGMGPIITVFVTVIFSVGIILQLQIKSVNDASKERIEAVKELH